MRTKNVLYCVLVVVLLCFLACKSEKVAGTPAGALLAKVNGVAITEDDIYLRLEGGHGGRITPEMRAQALDDLINQELLYQQGLKLGLDKDAKFQNTVKVMEMRLKEFKRAEMARRVGSTRIAATVNVTEDDVSRYIEANADKLRTEFHLEMIRFTDEAEAKEALAKIRSGATFESMAQGKFPHAPKAGKAPWDLGYVPWNQLPIEWREAIERLGKGEVSGVLQGKRTGIAIIKLVDRRNNRKLDIERMRSAIMNGIRDEKLVAAYDEYVNSLRSKAKIIQYKEGKTLEK